MLLTNSCLSFNGKAAFLKLLDREGKIQAYVRRDEIGDDEYATFKKLDLGDFIGVRGPLFRTKTVRGNRTGKGIPFSFKVSSSLA